MHQLLFPNFADPLKELRTPPLITVGSIFACVKILDIRDVVVVFHETQQQLYFSLMKLHC